MNLVGDLDVLGLSDEKRKLLAYLLDEEGVERLPVSAIPARADTSSRPLSFAQQQLWLIDQLAPDSAAYVIAGALRLDGALDCGALAHSLSAIVARHEVLRSTFPDADGQPLTLVAPPQPLQLPLLDLQAIQSSRRSELAIELFTHAAQRPFNLARGPLLRVTLLRCAAAEHILLIELHHIVADGWSLEVLLNELGVLYRAKSASAGTHTEHLPTLPALPIQYADYAAWQRQELQGAALDAQLSYWRRALADAPPTLALPTDGPQQAGINTRGARHTLVLDPTTTAALHALGQQEGATLFMLLLAAFDVLLARLSGQDELVVGAPVAGRAHATTEPLIGCFVNTLVLRSDLRGDPTFRELARRVRTVCLEGYAHQDLPFEQLVRQLNPERGPSGGALFEVMLNSLTFPTSSMELPGLTLTRLESPELDAKHPLTLYVAEQNDGLRLDMVYQRARFAAARVQGMLAQLHGLLAQIAAAPDLPLSAYTLVTPQMRALLPDPRVALPMPAYDLVPTLIAAQAAYTPDAIALVQGDRAWSYAILAEHAAAIGRALVAQQVTQGAVVALHGPRCFGLIAGMLGVWTSGAVLLALDPALPPARQRLMLQEANAVLLLVVGAAHELDWPSAEAPCATLALDSESGQVAGVAAPLAALPRLAADDRAYLCFTSGTSGTPKGVLGIHAGLAHFLAWQRATFAVGPADRSAQLTGLSFDVVLRDIFLPLTSGAALCLPDATDDLGADRVLPWMERQRITLLHTVPALAHAWLGSPPAGIALATLRWVFFAGEPLTDALVRRWRATFPATGGIANFYGPTETTLAKCCYVVPDELTAGVQPVGWPLPQTQALVLTANDQLCGVGEPGEIVIRTPFRSLGYINAAGEQFVPNPFSKGSGVRGQESGGTDWLAGDEETSRQADKQTTQSAICNLQSTMGDLLYRTGDRGRYRLDGALDILGRIDQQVKLRGIRVEPDEVAAVLARHAAVHACAVVAQPDAQGEIVLVAYVVQGSEVRDQGSGSEDKETRRQGDKETDSRGTIYRALPTPDPRSLIPELHAFLAAQLPSAMVPAALVLLDALPLTPNGKLDRRKLPAPEWVMPTRSHTFVAPRTPVEEVLAAIWADVLGLEQVGIEDNFFALGGHSLLATQLVARLRMALPVELSLGDLFAAPSVAGLAELLGQRSAVPVAVAALPAIQPDPTQRYQPFPLTDIQHAYWIGRSGALELGTVGTHGYMELDSDTLDLERFAHALRRLVARHDMLRAIIQPDGQQRVLATVPAYPIPILDVGALPSEARETQLAAVRARMSHQVLPSDRWPLFEIRATRVGQRIRLHISTDALICDAWSRRVLVRELGQLYQNPAAQLPPLSLTFRDYVLAEQALTATALYQRSQSYWWQRLATLPPVADLPLAQLPDAIINPRFVRHADQLEPDDWQRLKARATRAGLTPSGVLLAAFAEVLARWSTSARFTINLTLFNRLPLDPQVGDLVGDFTTLTLLAVEHDAALPFVERARRMQAQLWQDIDHRYVSGVQVLRELVRRQGGTPRAVMPIVFTSTLIHGQNDPLAAPLALLGTVGYGISQTPQVWLDHQVTERDGALLYNWDAVAELFPAGLLEAMFGAYSQLLRGLIDTEAAWQARELALLPPQQHEQRAVVNTTAAPLSGALLHDLFAAQVAQRPGQAAVVTTRRTLTYAELAQRANRLAQQLRRLDVQPNTLVAVVMDKGWEQVVALLGVLEAGAAYLPLDASLPAQRLQELLAHGEVRIALTQSRHDARLAWPAGLTRLCLDDECWAAGALMSLPALTQPADLAYVIYTSGSTGMPKGVMIDHRAAVNTIIDMNAYCAVEPGDRVFALSSLSFDLSVYDIFGTLAAGATIIMPDATDGPDPAHWAALLVQEQVTIWNTVPALLELLVAYLAPRRELWPWSLRLALLSGDWIPLALPAQVRALVPDIQLLSLGGATEAAIWSIRYPIDAIDPTWKSIPYGTPMRNQSFHVLNDQLEACPVWVPGQLYIGGVGLAQGYWRDPVKTVERFVPNPFAGDKERGRQGEGETPQSAICNLQSAIGERLYKTGDLGRYLPDGTIEFLGRADFQVKLQGYRIELGEIEAALLQHTSVRAAVVAAVGEARGHKRLVAYVVEGSGIRDQGSGAEDRETRRHGDTENPNVSLAASRLPTPDPRPLIPELRDFLRSRLPEYMLPAAFVLLDALPLSANGKLDRKALPLPDLAAQDAEADFVAPRSPTEEILAALWAGVLNLARVGIHDQFFAIGGDSLLATRLMVRLRDTFQIELPLRALFEAPSVAELAERIDHARRTEIVLAPPLRVIARDGELPLSFAQRRLWFLDQLMPGNPFYNVPAAARLLGRLDLTTLRRSLDAIIERHELLRTTITTREGQPVQQIAATIPPLPLMLIDLDECPASARAAAVQHLATAVAQRPFDLARGPLLRAAVLRLGEQEHVLLVTMHHIVSDAWSMGVLLGELAALYAAISSGTPVSLAALPFQYIDFAVWQRRWLQGQVLDAQLAYWRARLGTDLPALDLPSDRPRPALPTMRGATRSFALPDALAAALKALSQREGVTLFMSLLAAWKLLLARYSGQTDIVVGAPIAGRTHAETEALIGFFVNTLVLRSDLSGGPRFVELLAQVRAMCLDAYAHQDVPFELLVEALQPERDLSRTPLFQVLFTLQNTPLPPLQLPGAQLLPIKVDGGTAKFELTLFVWAEADGLAGALEYRTELFDATTIERLCGHYRTLLAAIVAEPTLPIALLPLLTSVERQQMVLEWNATAAGVRRRIADVCLHDLVAAQAARTPDAIALVCADALLSYHELDRRANQLAHYLRARGVGPETRVASALPRTPELLIGLLGVLKAGAAYLPIDPSYPSERISFMLADSGATVLLAATNLQDKETGRPGDKEATNLRVSVSPHLRVSLSPCLDSDWPAIAQMPTTPPPAATTSDQLAYVIYTSGSTGVPKGVMVSHRSVVNFFSGMDRRIGCSAADTLLAVTSVAFDISVLELFWTLTRGARVVLLDEQLAMDSGGASQPAMHQDKDLQFSLFYFASDESGPSAEKYRLLLEGAAYADQHEFAAVWTPERHFHAFGGLYPNPAVTSAALAAITKRIQIRAGSVVLPLHDPIRVAEEWSLVDNLSHGRVGIAFASGWHADDFVFFPDRYAARKQVTFQGIETVQRLWRGEAVTLRGGAGNDVSVRIFPRPIQPELPVWITAAGNPETFVEAGRIGANLLTHLLGQSLDEVAEKITRYRAARAAHGHDPATGHVTLMLHTFVGDDYEAVREIVRAPLIAYLRSSLDLIEQLITSLGMPFDRQTISDDALDDVLNFAFERYFATSGLFGTPSSCDPLIARLKAIGVDEVACLIDFGVAQDAVLAGLRQLNLLRVRANARAQREYSLRAQATAYRASLLQCTPSLMQLLLADAPTMQALRSLRVLLLGGEALPTELAQQVRAALPGRLVNMYGPTETTIWSATYAVDAAAQTVAAGPVAIGRPIANTQIYLLDAHMQPVPVGVPGELFIGGAGVARGYLGRPTLTAERFIPNPFVDERRKTKDEESDSSFVFRPSSRLYATGDRARYRSDGTLVFLGRIDQQVKLRGVRIELGEIEAALAQHPAVRASVVVVREDVPGDARLVAYVVQGSGVETARRAVSTPDPRPLIPELREHLGQTLPAAMIPAAFVLLDALPLTPNGKLDRAALPVPDAVRDPAQPFIAPRTPTEEVLAQIWAEVLGRTVGAHDNFFALGGHSLLATQIMARVRAIFQVEIPLRQLFETPTVAALATRITAARQTEPALLEPPLRPVSRIGALPLSFAQQRMWFLDQLEPGNPFYNDAAALQLDGPLQIVLLQHSLQAIVRRHEALRTTFATLDGQPRQVIAPALEVLLPLLDLGGLPADRRTATGEQLATIEARRPFDLAYGPLLRATLLRITHEEHVLLVTLHHIVSDGWSLGVLFRELATLYAAYAARRPAPLPALPIQYADYAVWQRSWLQGALRDTQLAYWKQQLAELPVLALPTDRPRLAVQSFRGATQTFALPQALTTALHRLSRQVGVTLYMALLTAFQALLARYTGQTDIVVGSPIANRTRPELEGLIGVFVNTLVLRADLSGDPGMRELARRVRGIALDAYAHQDVPFEMLVEALQPTRDLSRQPLFQVLFVLQNAPLRAVDLSELTMRMLEIDGGTAKFDLGFELRDGPQGLQGWIEYATDLFDATTIRRLVGHWQTLLAGMVADVDRRLSLLPLLTAAEQQQLVFDSMPAIARVPREVCLHQLFADQAARTPDAVAIMFHTTNNDLIRARGSGVRDQDGAVPAPGPRPPTPDPWYLTYAELNQRANQLAQHLRTLGVARGQIVGICLERSPELVIALLGVLKAGAAYLPLDPDYPSERISVMLTDSGATVLLTDSIYDLQLTIDDLEQPQTSIVNRESKIVNLRGDWPAIARQPALDPQSAVTPDDLAYLIYTSGSTGQPKGVMVAHRMIVNTLLVTQQHFAFTADDSMPCMASFAFDIALFETFNPLLSGGCAILLTKAQILDVAGLVESLQRVTAFHTLPALMRQIVAFIRQQRLSERYAHIRLVVVGGDVVTPDLVEQMRDVFQAAQIYVLFGPTEGTIMCMQYRVPAGPISDKLIIGSPFRTMFVRIYDAHGQLVPIGIPGELYIGGASVTRGYLNRPELTAERFVPDQFVGDKETRRQGDKKTRSAAKDILQSAICNLQSAIGTRLYATGDRARYRPDGLIEFLGRIDDQVKVRGFRIELGEIEVTLQHHPAIQDAVAVAHADSAGERRLVAYIVPQPWSEEQKQLPLAALPAEQVAEWQMVFDEAYQAIRPQPDPTFNISGWNSSYTGQPIPAAEMRVWLEQTIARIQALGPQRVLEIGCGTGLVLFRIAPLCTHYLGTDFSPTALSYLRQQLQRLDRNLAQVALLQRPADDLAGLTAGSFDTVILNSVVQYFPSVEYLVRVLAGAARLVAPGGRIFVGDVRSLPLLTAFHTSVDLFQAADSLPVVQLLQRVNRHIAQEQELVVDPDFFGALLQYLPQISHVQIQLKRGRYHNELTRFRYDVLLYIDAARPADDVAWLDWQREGLTLAEVRRILAERAPATLGLAGVPNARLAGDMYTLELLASDQRPAIVGELRQALAVANLDAGIDPEELWALGDELPYTVTISWSGTAADRYDVVFARHTAADSAQSPQITLAARSVEDRVSASGMQPASFQKYANNPLHEKLARELIPVLRSHLKEKLPEYMLPATFMLLDALPLTHNGKVDRTALPEPPQLQPELGDDFVVARTPVEQTLAAIWAQVLDLAQVGINNNFFELGGDSIHSIQVVARANQAGLRLTPRQLFQYQTIAELAAVVQLAPSADSPPSSVDASVLTPFQRWFFEHDPPVPQCWHRTMLLELPPAPNFAQLAQALRELLRRHDALRLRFTRGPAGWAATVAPLDQLPFTFVDLSVLPEPTQQAALATAAADLRDGLDLAQRPFQVIMFARGADSVLLLIIHELLADEVAWRIVLEELQTAYDQRCRGEPITLPPTSSFLGWTHRLASHTRTAQSERHYWLAEARTRIAQLPATPDGDSDADATQIVALALGSRETRSLHEVYTANRTRPDELLLAALAQVLADWTANTTLLVELERDGREWGIDDLDLSRMVGQCTTIFPLLIELAPAITPGELLKAVKEQVRGVPHAGIGYGLLRYLDADDVAEQLRALPQAEVRFAYQDARERPALTSFTAIAPPDEQVRPPRSQRQLELRAELRGDQLYLEWIAANQPRAVIERLAQAYLTALRALIAHSLAAGGYTPSDFPRARVSQQDLDRFLAGISQPKPEAQ